LTAWLAAQTIGPARITPMRTIGHCSRGDTPDATTPQANAHMGGNQVIGLNSSKMADGAGSCIRNIVPVDAKKCQLEFTLEMSTFL
jgi:hypothetical protein